MRKFFAMFMIGMGLFAQSPVTPTQPAAFTYAVNTLELFPTYTRASYLAKTGFQAPPFDITRPAKAWYDSTATGTTTYSVYNQSITQPAFVSVTLSKGVANSVNLPGLPTYPTYTQAQSNIIVTNGSSGSGYSSLYQSTLDQANSLKAEIGDSTIAVTSGLGPMFPGAVYSYQKIDASNPVGIYFLNGQNVGQLLQQRNANGVGFPGTWAKNALGNYSFTPATLNDGSTSTLGTTAVPVRALLSNEKLVSVANGLIPTVEVVRTDLPSTLPSTGPSSDFTAADRAVLNQLLSIAQALAKAFGVGQ